MSSKFRSLLIRDVCDTSSGGTPSRKVSDYFSTPPEGHPWLASRELAGGFVHAAEEHISQLGLENSSAKYFPVDTVLLAMYGATAGKVGRLAIPMTTSQAICGMVAKKGICHQGFLYYLIKNESWKIVWKNALGGAQPNISQFSINNHPVKLPEFASQVKIYNHLNRIDMLIENQEEQMHVLQDAIDSLFRSWFIDFDPVKARAEGKLPYGMGEQTAALFPDSFQDSELGPIPAGWKIGKLSEIAEITMGTSPPGESYCDLDSGILPLLNGAGDFNGSVIAPKQGTTQPTRIANDGDFVFCIRATIGNLSVCEERYCIGRGVASARERNWFDRAFLHQTISNLFRVWEWEATGSVIKGITGPEVKNTPVIIPPESIRKWFENTVMESMLMIQNCMTLKESLCACQETLLPRLMSGELEV